MTGSEGFIGRELVPILKTRPYADVYTIDKNPGKGGTRHLVADLGALTIEHLFPGVQFDAIFHLAASCKLTEGERYDADVKITELVCRRAAVDDARLVFTSTMLTLPGINDNKQALEYGASKRACEQVIKDTLHNYSICRLVTVWGPSLERFQNLMTRNILGIRFIPGDANSPRSYSYVENTVRALIAESQYEGARQGFITDEPASFGDLISVGFRTQGYRFLPVPKLLIFLLCRFGLWGFSQSQFNNIYRSNIVEPRLEGLYDSYSLPQAWSRFFSSSPTERKGSALDE